MSIRDGVERDLFNTSQGYYFDQTSGFKFQKLDKNDQTKNTYWGTRENGTPIYFSENTIDGLTPFAATVRNYGYNEYSQSALYVRLSFGESYRVSEFFHTHPGNSSLSKNDAFQGIVPCYAVGWDGKVRGALLQNSDGAFIYPEFIFYGKK